MYKAAVVISGSHDNENVLGLCPGINLTTGERNFREAFGDLSSLEVDVLTLASAVFASDLAFKRGERENITRKIQLIVPVVNLAAFRAVRDDIRYALYRLSHDAWDIQFVQREGIPEPSQSWKSSSDRKALLFSGGLDSLAAAIQCGEANESIDLVSHVTANQAVLASQNKLFKYLEQKFPEQFTRFAVRVGGADKSKKGFPFPADGNREETQRTRSFLFLALAGLVVRRRGIQDILMIAENGQLAIHLPLTAGRISAFSTHTAHPEFTDVMSQILSTLLSYPIKISNPFLYLTKAEVVAATVKRHSEVISDAISCWKASRVTGSYNHCGFCIPCLIRRIAIETHDFWIPEYKRDILVENVAALDFDDDGKCNLIELGEFVKLFEQDRSQAYFEDLYPDLINSHFDPIQAVALYQRFAKEARAVFNRYPQVRQLLQ